MMTPTEERIERADRWLRVAAERMLGVEPDWWLRMACGQVAEVSESLRFWVTGGPPGVPAEDYLDAQILFQRFAPNCNDSNRPSRNGPVCR